MDTLDVSSPLFISQLTEMEFTMMWNQQERAVKALEQRARRKAKSVGLVAIKSRKEAGSVDNLGGFRILDAILGTIEAGERFDLTAEEVIAFCSAE